MTTEPGDVLRLADFDSKALCGMLGRYQLELVLCAKDDAIPGSYWGDEEAGLKGNRVYARPDTPLHSILHESSHYVCLSPSRRVNLDTNAGSNVAEENAVCYLQILLADELPGFGRERMFEDMDAWGYSFRLGSSRAWFEQDAEDAAEWLLLQKLVDDCMKPLWCLRERED